jgi:hypothetical protein
MQRLYEIGFRRAGRWELRDGELALELLDLTDHQNVLYAFVSGTSVKYVGKTTQTLQRRMLGYLRPNQNQRTNWRNRIAIVDLLKRGKTIEILALADPGLFRYGSFHLNLAAGLEDSIIQVVKPEWNGGRTSTVIESPAEANSPNTNEEAQPEAPMPRIALAPVLAANPIERAFPSVIMPKSISAPRASSNNESERKALGLAPYFILKLHETYHRTGFFNVPVNSEKYFGRDEQTIKIYCGQERSLVTGKINRTANGNGTPRVMGAVPLREWFQKRKAMSPLKVMILDPATIYIQDV